MIGKILTLVVVGVIFTIAMLGAQYLHFQYFKVDVVFYSALYDAMAALVAVASLMAIGLLARSFNWFEKLQALAICGLAGYCFAISVPTVVDRSLSMYILEKLQQRGGAIRLDAFEGVFQNEYTVEHRLVDVRLTEQLESGTITIEDGCVRLTPRGDAIANVTRFYRLNLLPKTRRLVKIEEDGFTEEYTDDLTDPFRNSTTQTDYACS